METLYEEDMAPMVNKKKEQVMFLLLSIKKKKVN